MDAMTLEQKIELLMALAADDRESSPALSAPPGATGATGATNASRSAGVPDRPVSLAPRFRNAAAAGALRPLNLRTVRTGPGRRATLLRILMTNACSFNCHYCPMRRDRDMPRALLEPREVVRIFLEARRRGWCDGLFLTTGIPGRPTRVMDRLIEVLELLRHREHFTGYIHVKILPGAEPAQVERITALASRVSVNLEAPCGDTLASIAPEKNYAAAFDTLAGARSLVVTSQRLEADGRRRDPLEPGGVTGMTTQFVVGATPDSDRTIVQRAAELYAGGGVHHVHFAAFRPIRDTPLEARPAAPALREHRLYQSDYLLRSYGFSTDELVFGADGNLSLERDPKVAWALAHPERFPVDVATAPYEALVRVPGIGVATARRLVVERRKTLIRDLADLRRLGVQTARAAGFLALRGRRLAAGRWTEQLSLWDAGLEAGARHGTYEFSPGTFR